MAFSFRRAGSLLLVGVPVVFRMLIGALLISAGWAWLNQADPGGLLADSVGRALSEDLTVGFYAPFLERIVIPNASVFASLVSWGEFLSGISLFFGAACRVGAGVIAFQFLNYGLMGGPMSLIGHLILTTIAVVPVLLHSGRTFGIDRWLYRRWPNAAIW